VAEAYLGAAPPRAGAAAAFVGISVLIWLTFPHFLLRSMRATSGFSAWRTPSRKLLPKRSACRLRRKDGQLINRAPVGLRPLGLAPRLFLVLSGDFQ